MNSDRYEFFGGPMDGTITGARLCLCTDHGNPHMKVESLTQNDEPTQRIHLYELRRVAAPGEPNPLIYCGELGA